MADYGSLVDHAAPVMALLYGQAGVTTYPAVAGGPSTVPPGTAPPYRSVHIVADRPDGQRLNHLSTRFRARIYVHHVGASTRAARELSDLTAEVLLDVRPDVDGRSCYPIRHESSQQPLVNEPVAQTAVTITDVYRLESDPGVDGS